MRSFLIILLAITALITLTGCGGGAPAPQAGGTQANNPVGTGVNTAPQTVGNNVPKITRTQRTNTANNSQTIPTSAGVNLASQSDEQINKTYRDLASAKGPQAAEAFGRQAWATKFPQLKTPAPDPNSWSQQFLKNNRNKQSSTENIPTLR